MTTTLHPRSPTSSAATPRGRFRQRLSAWFHGPTLTRDLILIVLIKLAVLMTLKHAFFGHPQAEHMKMPPAAVAQQLLSIQNPSPESEGNHHDQ